jgi:hypothetical protein
MYDILARLRLGARRQSLHPRHQSNDPVTAVLDLSLFQQLAVCIQDASLMSAR